jgi:phosphatidylserine/phosphatidylglycerophosphate/cardiolipin synthase-like enzyme
VQEVWVVGSSIQPTSLSKLKKAGIPVRKNEVHDKTILVHAKFAGSADNRHLVFTGSHNWTYSANYRNDELFVRLESEDLYKSYYAHFNDAYNTGKEQ